jgi:hypothetical protein
MNWIFGLYVVYGSEDRGTRPVGHPVFEKSFLCPVSGPLCTRPYTTE